MFISFWIELAGWSEWAMSYFQQTKLDRLTFLQNPIFFPCYFWFQIFLEHFSRLAHINKISYLMFFFGGMGLKKDFWILKSSKTLGGPVVMTCCNVNSVWVFVTSPLCVFVWCYKEFWMEKTSWSRVEQSYTCFFLNRVLFRYIYIYISKREHQEYFWEAPVYPRCSWPRHLCLH